MSISFRYTTNLADLKNFQSALKNYMVSGNVSKNSKFREEMYVTLFMLLSIVLLELISELLHLSFNALSFIVGFMFFQFYYHYRARKYRNFVTPTSQSKMFGECQMTFDDESFTIQSEKSNATIGWDMVEDTQEDENYFFIILESIRGFYIPKRSLDSEKLCNEIRTFLSEKIKNKRIKEGRKI